MRNGRRFEVAALHLRTIIIIFPFSAPSPGAVDIEHAQNNYAGCGKSRDPVEKNVTRGIFPAELKRPNPCGGGMKFRRNGQFEMPLEERQSDRRTP